MLPVNSPLMSRLKTSSHLSLLAASLLLSACATQTYEAKPIEPAQALAEFRERSLQSPALQASMVAQGYPQNQFPIKAWGMQELTLATVHYHPQLEIARAQWRASQAAERIAAQRPNPGLSSQVEHHSKTDGGVSPWTLGLALDFTIETGGKREARMARAASLSEAARIDIGQLVWSLRSRLRQQLLDYQTSLQIAQLLTREVSLRQQIVDMLEKRLELGMVSDIDLNNARLNHQKALQALVAEQGRKPQILASLAEATGVPASALEGVTFSLLPPPEAALPQENLQRAALLNRLDLNAALARYAASEAKLKLEIAKQTPDISLAPGYAFDQNDNRWSLGFSTILALLHRNEGPIAEAAAQREVEARKFEELQSRILGDLEKARASHQAALDEEAKATRLWSAQLQRAAQTARQFEAGQIDRLEMTGVELETLVVEQGLLAARTRVLRALGMLEDAIQKPIDGSFLPDNPERKEFANEP